jgi:outer membrane protein assembly factor BamE (lipoprotein component of BamABCDE complex)
MRRAIGASLVVLVLLAGCKSLVGGGAALREDVAGLERGMTKTEVKEELGNPWDINVTESEYGTRTQWVYKEAYTTAGQLYIYFEDNSLLSKQY